MRKYRKLLLVFVLIIGFFFTCKGLFRNLRYETTFDQSFISPNRNTKIFVRYDYVSRPSVFLKDGREIYSYEGPGFMETLQFDVEWVDNDTFILYNKQVNESYTVEIPR
ncbi:hypothetical protein I588_04175 [Enterococcus pallens ATCC BAA-351]|uniref:Uncharacterized protein n=1 Tax=Enterococcus pallens ATCC BAA-351 TaxID=1158607 RepID=R2SBC3_9ENTE|nr:hypothetical protein UAU_03980 [Enterococcus pallens ATCC BAA-351]EOU15243.1 hypothetical protein I588_04175 [Enterococcus pallens ATCC BAA-351]